MIPILSMANAGQANSTKDYLEGKYTRFVELCDTGKTSSEVADIVSIPKASAEGTLHHLANKGFLNRELINGEYLYTKVDKEKAPN